MSSAHSPRRRSKLEARNPGRLRSARAIGQVALHRQLASDDRPPPPIVGARPRSPRFGSQRPATSLAVSALEYRRMKLRIHWVSSPIRRICTGPTGGRGGPLCQRRMRQTLLGISVLTGGEWCFDRAQEIPGFSS